MSTGGLTLEAYRSLPYTRVVERVTDEEGTYYVARYAELPGLMADGETRAEAIVQLYQAFDDYIRAHIEWGDPIPLPDGSDRVIRALASAVELEKDMRITTRPFERSGRNDSKVNGPVAGVAVPNGITVALKDDAFERIHA